MHAVYQRGGLDDTIDVIFLKNFPLLLLFKAAAELVWQFVQFVSRLHTALISEHIHDSGDPNPRRLHERTVSHKWLHMFKQKGKKLHFNIILLTLICYFIILSSCFQVWAFFSADSWKWKEEAFCSFITTINALHIITLVF